MPIPSDEDPREKLLAEFAEVLRKSPAERYVDLDTLLEVMDYSYDKNDDYLINEAMLLGERFYPQSVELAERRAFYYWEQSQEICQRYLADHEDYSTPVIDLLRAVLNAPANEEEDCIIQWINKVDKLSEFDVIAFYKVCNDYKLASTAIVLSDIVKSKAEYLPDVLWEELLIAKDYNLNDLKLVILEKMTDLFPFNAEYWRLLAASALLVGDYDKALQAVEYDLAIQPGNSESLGVKARALFGKGDFAGAIETMRKACEAAPESFLLKYSLANLYNELGMKPEFKAMLKDLSKNFPENFDIFNVYLAENPTRGRNKILAYFKAHANDISEEEITDNIGEFLNSGRYNQAAMYVDAAYKYCPDRLPHQYFWLPSVVYYSAGRYGDAIAELEMFDLLDHIEVWNQAILWLISMAIRMASAWAGGMYDTLKDLIETYIEKISDLKTVKYDSYFLSVHGAFNIINNVIAAYVKWDNAGRPEERDLVNPLDFLSWRNLKES